MRRPTLSRWLARELMRLSGLQRFSLRKLAAMAQSDNPRLAAPLLLYCVCEDRLDGLMELVHRDDLAQEFARVARELDGVDLQKAAIAGRSFAVPREYAKHLASYKAAYDWPETRAESKRMRWQRSRALQLEKGVQTAEICRALGLNPGNTNAYLKHGDVEKVSLEGATAIMRYLAAY